MKSTTCPIVALVSGKGGVGKSLLSVNLAEALAQQGVSVALLDADVGQTACATLMNESPGNPLMGSDLDGSPDLRSFWHPCASGVTLVQASVDPIGDEASQLVLYRLMDAQLSELRKAHDLVLIDAPAGVDGPVRWSLDRADMAVLLLVDEPTSVADAYRLVKSVWEQDPLYPMGAVTNFAETDAHGRDVLYRFGTVTQRFTGNAPFYLGWVPFSVVVRQSVVRQRPFVRDHQDLAAPVREVATRLIERSIAAAAGISTN